MAFRQASDSVREVAIEVLGIDYDEGVEVTFSDGLANVITDHIAAVVDVEKRRVVRRGMPHSSLVVADTFMDPSLVSVTDIGGNSVPSLSSMFCESAMVVLMPRLEGAVVYIWKYDGKLRFSTRRAVDASMSRKGSGDEYHLLSELWYAVGGPPLGAFFPDSEELDGEGVAYVFVIVHPSLSLTSFVNSGNGYLVYLGAVCAYTGDYISTDSPRLKWEDLDNLYDPTIPPTKVDAGSILEEVGAEIVRDCVKPPFSGEIIGVVDKVGNLITDFVDDVIGEESVTTFTQMEYGAYSPFPPPSSFSRAFPPRGNARASALRCLFDARGDDGELPPIYTPSLFTFEEAMAHLRFGFHAPETARAIVDANSPLIEDVFASDGVFSRGEPVIACAYTAYTKVVNGVEQKLLKATSVTYIPKSHLWRQALGGGNSNFERRIAELSSKAEASHSSDNQSLDVETLTKCFTRPLSFWELCPSLPDNASGLVSDEVLKALITDTPTICLSRLYDALAHAPRCDAPWSAIATRWICILYAISLSPQHQKRVFAHILGSEKRVSGVVDAVVELYMRGEIDSSTRNIFDIRAIADSKSSAIRDRRTMKFAPGVYQLAAFAIANRGASVDKLTKRASGIPSDVLYSMSRSASALMSLL